MTEPANDEQRPEAARMQTMREAARPAQCNYTGLCWVALGDAAIHCNNGQCRGCGATPLGLVPR